MNFKKISKWFYSHQFETIVGVVSLITLVVGFIAIKWIAIPIILVIDAAILFGPELFQKLMKKINKGKKKKDGDDDLKKLIKEPKPKKEKKVKKEKKPGRKAKIIAILLTIVLVGMIVVIAGAGIFFYYIASKAPSFNPDELFSSESTIVYANDGETIIATLGAEKREKITYDDLPEVFVDALIATEDSRYFQHNGFDFPRFMKASIGQVLGNSSAGGASTITMQVSKNTYTSTEASGIEGIIRKFTDIYLSIFEIEKKYSKQEIIEYYINNNLLGGNNYGVEQASLTYFGKSAKDMNLSEAALLAGMFQSPNAYNPLNHPEAAATRRNTVLKLMVRHGYITQEQADIAASIPVEKLTANSKGSGDNTQYQGFIDTVVSEIKKDTGKNPYTTAMKIYSTMNITKQNIINGVMNGTTFNWENAKVQAGIVVLDTKSGAIVAVGTNRDSSASGLLNHATFENQTKRQIGSTAKPLYDYGPAIEYTNASPAMLIVDEPYHYSDGNNIGNFDGGYKGMITYRSALAGSRNVPALKVFQTLKKSNVLEFVKNLGLSPEASGNTLHEAHAIGGYTGESPLTMAAAYAAIGNGGVYNETYSYTKVIFRDTGEEYVKKHESHRAMSEDTAFILQDMLLTVAATGLGQYSYINNWGYGAKTGTSNFSAETKAANHLASDAINDHWVVGETDEYAIALWYGYDKIYQDAYTRFANTEHLRMFRHVASQIWTRNINHTATSGVTQVVLESNSPTPMLPSEYTPAHEKYVDWFKKGSEPTEVSDRFAQLSNVTNLKASSSNGLITLSWTATKSKWLTAEHLRKNYSKIFTDEGFLTHQVNSHMTWNEIYLGTIGYDIYELGEDDTYTLIGTTDETTFQFEPSSTLTTTYKVKTIYTKYKANASTGVTVNAKVSGTPTYSVKLANQTIPVGGTYDYNSNVTLSSKLCKLSKVSFDSNSYNSWDDANNVIKTKRAGAYRLTATYLCGASNRSISGSATITITNTSAQ